MSPALHQAEVDHTTLAGRVDDMARARLLCVGDVMLDRFVYGSVERISPEAPIPVFSQESDALMLGGAGNVVRNIVSLGASACFVSVVGDDDTGKQLIKLVGAEPRLEPHLFTEAGRVSTLKTRYVAGRQQVLRADREVKQDIATGTASKLVARVKAELPNYDALVLSDYAKGVLSADTCTQLIEAARAAGKSVLVDPKHRDYAVYHGATMLTPNFKEFCEAAGRSQFASEDELVKTAQEMMLAHGLESMLITRGKDGMLLVTRSGGAWSLPAQAREVFDVSGAGDTVMATYAAALCSEFSPLEAAFTANIAAGIVVGRLGTATIFRTDLKTALYTHNTHTAESKVLPQNMAQSQVANWKRAGLKVGFTNGCFDIMHAGHLSLLQDAKSRCDRLIVAVNSDESVKRLNKGPERPVNREMDRAMLLAALSYVDMVVIFREDTPLQVLELLKPDVLMKGSDYQKHQVVGWEMVEAYGGTIELIPLKEGYSTTGVISKLRG